MVAFLNVVLPMVVELANLILGYAREFNLMVQHLRDDDAASPAPDDAPNHGESPDDAPNHAWRVYT